MTVTVRFVSTVDRDLAIRAVEDHKRNIGQPQRLCFSRSRTLKDGSGSIVVHGAAGDIAAALKSWDADRHREGIIE